MLYVPEAQGSLPQGAAHCTVRCTTGEAWERVQQFHDNPRRWGLHADPPEPQAGAAAGQGAAASDFAGGRDFAGGSFDDLFERWFGV